MAFHDSDKKYSRQSDTYSKKGSQGYSRNDDGRFSIRSDQDKPFDFSDGNSYSRVTKKNESTSSYSQRNEAPREVESKSHSVRGMAEAITGANDIRRYDNNSSQAPPRAESRRSEYNPESTSYRGNSPHREPVVSNSHFSGIRAGNQETYSRYSNDSSNAPSFSEGHSKADSGYSRSISSEESRYERRGAISESKEYSRTQAMPESKEYSRAQSSVGDKKYSHHVKVNGSEKTEAATPSRNISISPDGKRTVVGSASLPNKAIPKGVKSSIGKRIFDSSGGVLRDIGKEETDNEANPLAPTMKGIEKAYDGVQTSRRVYRVSRNTVERISAYSKRRSEMRNALGFSRNKVGSFSSYSRSSKPVTGTMSRFSKADPTYSRFGNQAIQKKIAEKAGNETIKATGKKVAKKQVKKAVAKRSAVKVVGGRLGKEGIKAIGKVAAKEGAKAGVKAGATAAGAATGPVGWLVTAGLYAVEGIEKFGGAISGFKDTKGVAGLISKGYNIILGLLLIIFLLGVGIFGPLAGALERSPLHLLVSTIDGQKDNIYTLADTLIGYYTEFNEQIYKETDINTEIRYTNEASNFLDVLEIYASRIKTGEDPCAMTKEHKAILKDTFDLMNSYVITSVSNKVIRPGENIGVYAVGTLTSWNGETDGYLRSAVINPSYAYQFGIDVDNFRSITISIGDEKFRVVAVGNTGNVPIAVLHPNIDDEDDDLYLKEEDEDGNKEYYEKAVFNGSSYNVKLVSPSISYSRRLCVVTNKTANDYMNENTLTNEEKQFYNIFKTSLKFLEPDLKDYIESCKYVGRTNADVIGSKTELYLFYQCVMDEAGNQGTVGQRAVAEVIINRVRNGSYPNSIRGVITAPGQFAGYLNGNYNGTSGTKPSREVVESVNSVLDSGYEFMFPDNVLMFKSGGAYFKSWGTPYVRIKAHYFSTQGTASRQGFIKKGSVIADWEWAN